MPSMEPLLDYIKRKLKDAGPKRWPAIAEYAGCSVHTLRKIAYSDQDNPSLAIVQPLIDLFRAVESGARTLPEPAQQQDEPA